MIDQRRGRESSVLAHLFTALFVYTLIGAVTSDLCLWSSHGAAMISGAGWKIAGGILFCCLVGRLFFPQSFFRRIVRFIAASWWFGVGLVLLLSSDFFDRRFIFYAEPVTRPLILTVGVLGAGAVLVLARGSLRRALQLLFSASTLLLLQIVLTIAFLRHADGRLLFSDDHPSFLYRLQLLLAQFPRLPFYNPEWNAGATARLLSTGVTNVFFLSWPLLRLGGDLSSFRTASIYTLLIPYLYLFLVPWSVVFAARLLGVSRPGAALAGFLALGPSLTYFEWLLKFGTISFVLSAALVPLALALAVRLIIRGEEPVRWVHGLALVVVLSLSLAWPLMFLAFVPLAVHAALRLPVAFSKPRRWKVLATLLLLVVVNSPWMFVFLRDSHVIDFVKRQALPGVSASPFRAAADGEHLSREGESVSSNSRTAWEKKVRRAAGQLRQTASQLNPVILLFAIPGLLAMRKRELRAALFFTVLWLLFVAGAGSVFKPQLELRRMIIPASMVMSVLAAAGVVSFFESLIHLSRRRVAAAAYGAVGIVVLGAVLIAPLNVGAIYLNRSDQKYTFASRQVEELSEAIKRFGGSGRTMFLGFVLHELGSSSAGAKDGGHLAPLTKFSGKPLFASHYYHASWGAVDPIPRSFTSREEEGIEEFLDLVNVTAVVAFSRRWREYCRDHPNYTLVYHGEPVLVFSRRAPQNGFFLEGSGEVVRASEDRLEVIPSSSEIVLKFRYFPSLRVSPHESASIEPVFAFTEDLGGEHQGAVEFIRLHVAAEAVAKKKPIVLGFHVAE